MEMEGHPLAGETTTVPTGATVATRPDLFGTRGQFRPDGEGGISRASAIDVFEYNTPAASQVSDGFYVTERGLPWHVTLARQLGTSELMAGVGGLLTKTEALAAAGSFEVEKVPLQTSDGLVLPNHYATVRVDTREPLGVVGRSYKVLQEAELAEFADALVDSGEAKYETGGHMRGGAWFFLSMELDHLNISVPGDPSDLRTYLLLMTSHDGSKPASWHVTNVRTVCKNTADLAKAGAKSWYRFRHIGSLNGKVEQARQALGIAFRDTETVKAITERLALTRVVDAQVRDILAAAWPVRSADGDEERERQTRNAERAFTLYEESPNLDGIRGTAWGAYNAVTEYLDHAAPYRGGARQDVLDRKADSLLFGAASAAKDKALGAALALTR